MRCATCGEYIYKGKKFNARKEDVENEDYLGIRIYRFYIKVSRLLRFLRMELLFFSFSQGKHKRVTVTITTTIFSEPYL